MINMSIIGFIIVMLGVLCAGTLIGYLILYYRLYLSTYNELQETYAAREKDIADYNLQQKKLSILTQYVQDQMKEEISLACRLGAQATLDAVSRIK